MHYYAVTPLLKSTRETYTYRGSAGLRPGQVVRIPLGPQRPLGVVRGYDVPIPAARPLERLAVQLSKAQYELALWIAEEYLAHPGMALRQAVSERIVKAARQVPPGGALRSGGKPTLQIVRDRVAHVAAVLDAIDGPRLCLVPDLASARTLAATAKTQTVLYHSRLPAAERTNLWWRVAAGEHQCVIGLRAALHLPWRRLDLLTVLDEEEMGYKQDQTPRYHARAAAAKLARLTGADLRFVSASPSLETYASTTVSAEEPLDVAVQLVEPEQDELSYGAWEAIKDATGNVLVYTPPREQWRVEEAVTRSFSKRRNLRIGVHGSWRSDRTYDVAIACGVDHLLDLPEFRASEKALAVLRNLAASIVPGGKLVVETSRTDHPVLAAIARPYATFADAELAERRALSLPPASRLTRILFVNRRKKAAERQAEEAAAELRAAGMATEASPCPIPEEDGLVRWQVLVKGDPKRLRRYIARGWMVDVDPVSLL